MEEMDIKKKIAWLNASGEGIRIENQRIEAIHRSMGLELGTFQEAERKRYMEHKERKKVTYEK